MKKTKRVGVFGGSFNPLHQGHVTSLEEVYKKLNLDEIKVIPVYQSPGRELIESPMPVQRLEMLKLGLKAYSEYVEIDEREINKKEVSYSVHTMKALAEANPESEYFLIIGMDQFINFDKWKNFAELLSYTNLVVTTRPGYFFPINREALPEGVQPLVEEFADQFIVLNTDTNIQFLRIKDVDVSSTEIRKKIKLEHSLDKFVPLEVQNYILENKLYLRAATDSIDFEALTERVFTFFKDKDAIHPRSYDMTEQNYISDYVLVTSASNKIFVKTLVDQMVELVKNEFSIRPIGVEGYDEAGWVVVDYGGLIAHVFYEPLRQEICFEDLLKKALNRRPEF